MDVEVPRYRITPELASQITTSVLVADPDDEQYFAGTASRWPGHSPPNGSSTSSTTMSVERLGASAGDSGNDDEYGCESVHFAENGAVSVVRRDFDDEIRCLHDTSK
jgi:hypothetical protein